MPVETHRFETEVSQLLQLIIHSLYSNKEIFIRELVSNASDALDKLKYLTLTDEAFKSLPFDPRIDIEFDEENHNTITIRDTGIGMNEEDLIANLGTIASSGTRNFISNLTGDAKRDSNLIGQFGVGFYACFMVADRVQVVSRKAGEDASWRWESDGKGEFTVEPTEKDSHGTDIILYLNNEGKSFASRWRIEEVVKKYSNHIAFPIYLHYEKKEYDDKGKVTGSTPVSDQVNSASALWKRSKSEISDEEYKEFYKTIAHGDEDPLFWLHTQAEGTLEYTTLFFVPKHAPMDMYYVDYRPGVKLYVRRVFITDDEKELMPAYLRFLRGVIDSEDLPLNVSREILQENRVLATIKTQSVKKVLGELERIANNDPDTYKTFISQYNRPLKEGLYSDYANREQLLKLVRYKSTSVDGMTSLADYKSRMLEDQKAIYYITGDKEHNLRHSPLLEAYRKKNIEVLIMDDDLDEIVVPTLGEYDGVELKPVNRSDAGEDIQSEKDEEKEAELKPALERVKSALGEQVKDVRSSVRLADSPSCIVVDDSDPTMKMQQLLKAMGQQDAPEVVPILEVNPDHAIVRRLIDADDETLEDLRVILLGQAILVEGGELKDPADFVKRVNRRLGS
ncbi:MAG: molecular chaperone HtpG [Spirochaetota bacterium]